MQRCPRHSHPQDARDETTAQVQGGSVRAGPLVRLLDGRVHRQVGPTRGHALVQRIGVLVVAEEAPVVPSAPGAQVNARVRERRCQLPALNRARADEARVDWDRAVAHGEADGLHKVLRAAVRVIQPVAPLFF